jgi:hypothetical protein
MAPVHFNELTFQLSLRLKLIKFKLYLNDFHLSYS